MDPTETDIVHATEMYERVVEPIANIRNPERLSSHKADLRRYKRRLGKRSEVTATLGHGWSSRKARGFKVRVYDQEVFVERPELGRVVAYGYSPYDRSFGFSSPARHYGLLADPIFNRDIRLQRVEEYGAQMEAGRWRDLLSDPIAVTPDGHVLNGQHRIAAAVKVDWAKAGNDPAFLVVWNVDPQESLYADGSRRTPKDEQTIATKLLDQERARAAT